MGLAVGTEVARQARRTEHLPAESRELLARELSPGAAVRCRALDGERLVGIKGRCQPERQTLATGPGLHRDLVRKECLLVREKALEVGLDHERLVGIAHVLRDERRVELGRTGSEKKGEAAQQRRLADIVRTDQDERVSDLDIEIHQT